jgi:hypothetical protein
MIKRLIVMVMLCALAFPNTAGAQPEGFADYRVVNGTGSPVDVYAEGAPIAEGLAPGRGTPYFRVHARTLMISTPAETPVHLLPGRSYTVLLVPGGSAQLLEDDRSPIPPDRARITAFNASGSLDVLLPDGGVLIDDLEAGEIYGTVDYAAGPVTLRAGDLTFDNVPLYPRTFTRLFTVGPSAFYTVAGTLPGPEQGALRVVNGTGAAFDMGIDGAGAWPGLGPGEATAYLPLDAGTHTIGAAGTAGQIAIEAGLSYTLFAAPAGIHTYIDAEIALPAGFAALRVLNGGPDLAVDAMSTPIEGLGQFQIVPPVAAGAEYVRVVPGGAYTLAFLAGTPEPQIAAWNLIAGLAYDVFVPGNGAPPFLVPRTVKAEGGQLVLRGTVNVAAEARLMVRSGPGIDRPVLAEYAAGQVVDAVGRSADEAWLYVRVPESVDLSGRAWVAARFVALEADDAAMTALTPVSVLPIVAE